MTLTLESAMELSERKWQAIVDNDGDTRAAVKQIYELHDMENQCAMCQLMFQIRKSGTHICVKCIYSAVCSGEEYPAFLQSTCVATAQDVLDKIKEINEVERLNEKS